jgi:TPR repeat protein
MEFHQERLPTAIAVARKSVRPQTLFPLIATIVGLAAVGVMMYLYESGLYFRGPEKLVKYLAGGSSDPYVKYKYARFMSWGPDESDRQEAGSVYKSCAEDFELGRGANKNIKRARECYKLAVDLGYRDAQYGYARLLEKAGDRKGAKKYYKLAANRGNADAQREYARLLERAGDHEGAKKYYKLAADQGDTAAQREYDRLSSRRPRARRRH